MNTDDPKELKDALPLMISGRLRCELWDDLTGVTITEVEEEESVFIDGHEVERLRDWLNRVLP